VRGYRLGLDALAQNAPVPPEALQAVMSTDSRGWMSGFYTSEDPLPQNLANVREGTLKAEVVAQIRSWQPEEQSAVISVRNRIDPGEILELLTPQGTSMIQVSNLRNQRGESVSRLHSGLENCRLQLDVPPNLPEFSFLVRRRIMG